MYELIQLTENDYYFNCPAKIGLVKLNETDVILIDSGNDKDAGRKVLRVIEANGWTLKAIYNTHSHADHIGGNKFLQTRTACKIYGRGLESAFTNAPILEPIGLYGGRPFKELKHKFIMAQESSSEYLSEDLLPEGMKLLPLPGHCFEMVGFLTADGTAYIADSVSTKETLQKYGIGYLWDYSLSLKTLEEIKSIKAERFVPSHADVTEDISELADFNADAIRKVRDIILKNCADPITFEKLLKKIFEEYQLTMTAQQYALIGSTLRSYLSNLYEEKVIKYEFIENEMMWSRIADE